MQQNKQLQPRLTEISEMSVIVKKVLELQLSMIRETREDVKAVLQCSEKLPLPGPKIMAKTQKHTKRGADESKCLMVAFEDCEYGPKNNHSIKMQSTTTSSVIATTDSEDLECGPIISIKM